jgi:hypothetical protein
VAVKTSALYNFKNGMHKVYAKKATKTDVKATI